MAATSFTFLNTTDAPGLSRQAAKVVRGHITKTNFAKRRQRKAETRAKETRSSAAKEPRDAVVELVSREAAEYINPNRGERALVKLGNTYNRDLRETAPLLYGNEVLRKPVPRLLSLFYPDTTKSLETKQEIAWFHFHASEPALLEATLAVAERYWSPDPTTQLSAQLHWNRAADIVIQHIQSDKAQSDAVLAAVLTMAFGERLAHNDDAWTIHINGLVHMIQERHSRGIFSMPPWFMHLIIL